MFFLAFSCSFVCFCLSKTAFLKDENLHDNPASGQQNYFTCPQTTIPIVKLTHPTCIENELCWAGLRILSNFGGVKSAAQAWHSLA